LLGLPFSRVTRGSVRPIEKGLDWLGEAKEAHQNNHHYVISSLDNNNKHDLLSNIIPNHDAEKSRFDVQDLAHP